MKFTNISKFIIKFMGGGKINFPFNHLKEVEINGDNDGEGGGDESSDPSFSPFYEEDTLPIGFITFNYDDDIIEPGGSYNKEIYDLKSLTKSFLDEHNTGSGVNIMFLYETPITNKLVLADFNKNISGYYGNSTYNYFNDITNPIIINNKTYYFENQGS